MADNKRTVSIVIEAKNRADQALKGVGLSLGQVVVAAAAVTAAAAAMAAAFAKVTAAASKQEDADVRLAIALASIGENTAAARDGLSRLASELQDATTVGDEAIQELMATLIQLGRIGLDELPRVTRATLELSIVTRQDLTSAALLMAKAAQGQTQTLSRYGLVLDEAIPKSERFAALLGLLEKNTGSAEAAAKTFSGALRRIDNDWNDLLQATGKAVIENEALRSALQTVSDLLKQATKFVGEHSEAFTQLITVMARGALALVKIGIQFGVWEAQLFQANLSTAQFVAGLAGLASIAPALFSKVFGLGKGEAVLLAKAAAEVIARLEALKNVAGTVGAAGEAAIAGIEQILASLSGTSVKAAAGIQNFGSGLKTVQTAAEALDEILKELGAQTLAQMETQAKSVDEALRLVAEAQAASANPEQYDAIIERLIEMSAGVQGWTTDLSAASGVTSEIVNLMSEVQATAEQAATQGALQLGDAFVDAAFGAKISWGQAIRQILAGIAKAIAQALILRAIQFGLKFVGGGAGVAAGAAVETVSAGHGGEVRGGFPGLDSVAAFLTPGEIVLPRSRAEDFDAIAELGREVRRGARDGAASGERPGLLGAFQILPRRDDRDIGEIIEGITRLVERRGYRLVSSEVLP